MTSLEHTLKMVLAPEEIEQRVAGLAAQICTELEGKDLVMLGVLKGSFVFMADLVRHMDLSMEMDFIRLASYGESHESCGKIQMTKDCETDIKGRSVLVVEDIVDTGLTLKWLAAHLHARGAADVKICAFISKSERREADLDLDFVGFNIPRGFLVGYGLDYNEQYRHLAGLYEVVFAS